MSVVQRIRERKVVQWTASYLAGAWLVVEVVQTLREGIASPWFVGLLIALGSGLVLTGILAWYHGEKGRQRVSGAELIMISGVFVVAAVLFRLIPADPSNPSTAPSPADSPMAQTTADAAPLGIAVLPFRALGGGPDELTLAGGLHHELISQLRKIRDLQVKSPSSVLEYEGRPTNIRVVGEELGAEYVVEASVQASSDRVRIVVSLSDTEDDEILWNNAFVIERRVDDIFATQREIALRVATEAGAQILPAEREKLDVDLPNNLDALDFYMEGMYHLRGVRLGSGDMQRAAEAFASAIDADSLWAPARAGLGEALHWIATSGIGSEGRVTTYLEQSKASSEAALAIDGTYAAAWASLGFVLAVGDRDFEAADAAYRRAAELGGADPHGHGFILRMWGRWEEAQAVFEQAIAEDPRSSIVLLNAAMAHFCGRDFQTAIDLLERVRTLRPNAWGGQSAILLALSQIETGRTEEAMAQADLLWRNRRSGTVRPGALALLYTRLESESRARELLDEADLESGMQALAFNAAAALELGDRERALGYVERLGEQRRAAEQLLCFDFATLTNDERFVRALREGGLSGS